MTSKLEEAYESYPIGPSFAQQESHIAQHSINMVDSFKIDRKLGNPKFESFKLKPSTPAQTIPLLEPSQTSARLSNRSDFSLQKVQSVLRWNHISPLDDSQVVYIGRDRNIIIVAVDTGLCRSIFHVPVSISTQQAEHCCIQILSETLMCVSDGFNMIYIVNLEGIILSSFEIGTCALLMHAAQKFEKHIEVVISQSNSDKDGPNFRTSILKLDSELSVVTSLWTAATADLPYFAKYDRFNNSWCLGSSLQLAFEIPRHVKSDTRMNYCWTQDDETVTMRLNTQIFKDPQTTRIQIAADSLRVQCGHCVIDGKLWGPIDSSVSKQDWMNGQAVITFKKLKNIRYRWPSVFLEDDNIGETFEQEHIKHTKESLRSLTSDEIREELASEEVLSNLHGELDEVDSMRNPLYLSYWSPSDRDLKVDQASSTKLSLLALRIPGFCVDSHDEPPTIMVKEDVDGAVFCRQSSGTWNHIKTFPAVAFTLASKRSVQYVYHSDNYVLALEGRTGSRKAYLYIYHLQASRDSQTATQEIVEIGSTESGHILGLVELPALKSFAVICENCLVIVKPLH